jgi:3-deoxy-D-manno-octulosonic acid kinase
MRAAAVVVIDGQVILYNDQMLSHMHSQFFDPGWQQGQGHVHGTAPGRGRAFFFRAEGHDLVLRRFRRGGLIGKVNADRYLRLAAARSRSLQEYRLLEWMRAQGLPVPRPVAARYSTAGLFYRADLVTERIPQSRPLAEVLTAQMLPPAIWSAIGHIVRQMHGLGVDQSDLNCRNIVLDADLRVWLIDFNKCRRRDAGAGAQRNLGRLKRALKKERGQQMEFFWSDAEWPAFMAGYDRARA